MSTTFLVIIIALAVRFWNKKRVDLLTLKTENRLLEIRQDLIRKYLGGDINANQDSVYVLNNLIVRSSQTLNSVSIWVIIYSHMIRPSKSLPETSHPYFEEIEKEGSLKIHYTDFSRTILNYLVKKSIFSYIFFSLMFFIASRVSKKCMQWLIKIKESWRDKAIEYQDGNISMSA